MRGRGQVTIPQRVAKKYDIREGSFLELIERKGELALRPKVMIDPDQAWFWTKEWQKKEREADEDIKAGRISRSYIDVEELIKDLHKKSNVYRKWETLTKRSG